MLALSLDQYELIPAGPEQYSSFHPAANEEACLQVISQSETRRPFGGVGGISGEAEGKL